MIPWKEIGRAKVPSGMLILSQRDAEFALRLGGAELMNSRVHASEERLATLGLAGVVEMAGARVLVGGLGMGFTLRAALDILGSDARIDLSELVPEVVEWNRGPLAHLAGRPLDDPRVTVFVGDVAGMIAKGGYHAILLDVDNGPGAFTAPANASLYGTKGLARARRALVPGGVLGVWSVDDDRAFSGRLQGVGFEVTVERVPTRPNAKTKHVLWFARAPGHASTKP